jgi:ubiquinone/menaquinone biosynthesis C-methylase UbiE
MKADFDQAASHYDATFTISVIGKLQRNLVYNQLSKILKESNPKTILEINCGTGEDAVWLANHTIEVIATDISEKMIAIAKSKSNLKNVTFKQVDINTIDSHFKENTFDLIFSNFGGLNCLTPLEFDSFLKKSLSVLTSKGQLVLVVMPKNTLLEQLYFSLKLDFTNVFRRKKEFAIANVDGEKVKTYYFNPKDIVNLAKENFEIKQLSPIGFFVPPSYLESFISNKPKLISLLNSLEQKIKNQSWLSKYADHYLIVLQKK